MDIPNWSEITTMVSNAISTNQFFQGGAVLGILMALGNSLRAVPLMLWNMIERLIIYRVNIEEIDELFYYFEVWLSDNYQKKYRNVEASIKLKKIQYNEYISEGTGDNFLEEKVFYKQFNDVFYIRRGLSYIRISKVRDKLENASNMNNAFYNKFQLGGLSKSSINKLIEEVLEYNKTKKLNELKKSIEVKSCSEWGDWIKETVLEPKSMDKIYLENKIEILEDVEKFLSSEEYYRENGILYKRGYLLSGPPGNGKTSFLLSLAKKYNRTINFLNLNNVADKNIREAFRGLKSNSMLVIEDVDAAFDNRESSKNVKFSFSTLLNCLDGVFSKEDLIVIFTSNHPEKLDSALIREGRIDMKFEFKNPSKEIITRYLCDQFNDSTYHFKEYYPEYEPKIPMVNVQNLVIKNKDKSIQEVFEIIDYENSIFVPKVEVDETKKKKKKKESKKVLEEHD